MQSVFCIVMFYPVVALEPEDVGWGCLGGKGALYSLVLVFLGVKYLSFRVCQGVGNDSEVHWATYFRGLCG